MNYKEFFTKVRVFIQTRTLRQKIWYGIGIALVAGIVVLVAKPADTSALVHTDTVKNTSLKQTVLATGQVESKTDLRLSFGATGIVRSVRVSVGDIVSQGAVLATLDQKNQLADVTQARGTLLSAEARYKKILEGASNEEIDVAEKAVESAQANLVSVQKQQDVLVESARRILYSTNLVAESTSDTNPTAPTISGSYGSSVSGTYDIKIYKNSNNSYFVASGLESFSGNISITTAKPLGSRGLFIQLPTNFFTEATDNTNWKIEVPNTKSSSYSTNYNTYQSALQNRDAAIQAATSALNQRMSELNLKKASARRADLEAVEADVVSARGQVERAQANLEDTIVRAPASGTITTVDIKLGELAQALKQALVLQDVGNLHLKANINEANVSSIQKGQIIDVTFDALGQDKHYQARIDSIDPSSTIISGVVNYSVTAVLDKLAEIRPGMTANMTIQIAHKDNVLSVPLRAVLEHDEKKFVRKITNTKKKTYEEIPVITGLEADGGLVEIQSGLVEGDEIVVYVDKAK